MSKYQIKNSTTILQSLVRPFRLDATDASRGITPVVILWVTSHKTHMEMISPDRILHPVKLNNFITSKQTKQNNTVHE